MPLPMRMRARYQPLKHQLVEVRTDMVAQEGANRQHRQCDRAGVREQQKRGDAECFHTRPVLGGGEWRGDNNPVRVTPSLRHLVLYL